MNNVFYCLAIAIPLYAGWATGALILAMEAEGRRRSPLILGYATVLLAYIVILDGVLGTKPVLAIVLYAGSNLICLLGYVEAKYPDLGMRN